MKSTIRRWVFFSLTVHNPFVLGPPPTCVGLPMPKYFINGTSRQKNNVCASHPTSDSSPKRDVRMRSRSGHKPQRSHTQPQRSDMSHVERLCTGLCMCTSQHVRCPYTFWPCSTKHTAPGHEAGRETASRTVTNASHPACESPPRVRSPRAAWGWRVWLRDAGHTIGPLAALENIPGLLRRH